MPVNNALAEQISTGQSEDPFKRVLEYGQIGEIGHRNRLLDAETAKAGAQAGEASTASGRNVAETNRIKTLTPLQAANEKARTAETDAQRQNALAQVELHRSTLGAMHAQRALDDPTSYGIDEFDRDSQGQGAPPMDPQLKQRLKSDPAQAQQFFKGLSMGGVPPGEFNRPHFPQTGSGFYTMSGGMQGQQPVPVAPGAPTQPGAPLATVPPQPAPYSQNTAPLSPREKAGQASMGGADTKYTETVSSDADNARTANATLDEMRRDASVLAQKGYMGPGMEKFNEGRAILRSMYDNNIMGAKSWMPPPDQDATAAYQSMVKNAGMVTRQVLMQMHDRAAYAMPMVEKTLPGSALTAQGFDIVTSEMQGLNDYKLAKQEAMNKTPVAGRSDQFSSDWNKNVDPSYFIMKRMNPENRQKAFAELSKTPEGLKAIKSWQDTDKYLNGR